VPFKISLMKYTDCCFTSVLNSGCSIAMIVLTTALVAEIKSSSTSSDFGGTSVGKDFRYYLSSMKAAISYSSHWKPSAFCNSLYKGITCSPDIDVNLLSVAILPASFCISLRVQGGSNCSIASTFFGLASIP
jgi:hypothetical protein